MNLTTKRHTIVFVIRLWAEYLSENPCAWRGTLSGIEPKDDVPFASLEEMNALLMEKAYGQLNMKKRDATDID